MLCCSAKKFRAVRDIRDPILRQGAITRRSGARAAAAWKADLVVAFVGCAVARALAGRHKQIPRGACDQRWGHGGRQVGALIQSAGAEYG